MNSRLYFNLLLILFVLPASCGGRDTIALSPANGNERSVAARLAADATLAPLDYNNFDLWPCRGEEGDLCTVTYEAAVPQTDGSEATVTVTPAQDPPIDCFFIYPTLDFKPVAENHEELTDVELPLRTIIAQSAPFSQVCRVFAPLYRQATLFAYGAETSEAVQIFKNAFADVANAFEHYLEHWNDGRPIVVMGHSQGAQHSTYLLHSYFDGDTAATSITGSETTSELRARLVAALPIGFRLFAADGAVVGGSLADIPACTAIDETGCLITYRSYTENDSFSGFDRVGIFGVDQVMAEQGYLNRGFDADRDRLICVNPATEAVTDVARFVGDDGESIPAGDVRLLQSAQFLGAVGDVAGIGRNGRLHLERFYSASCRFHDKADNYLAIGKPATDANDLREDPIPIDSFTTTGALGTLGLHLWDFTFAMGDLIEQVRRKTEIYLGE